MSSFLTVSGHSPDCPYKKTHLGQKNRKWMSGVRLSLIVCQRRVEKSKSDTCKSCGRIYSCGICLSQILQCMRFSQRVTEYLKFPTRGSTEQMYRTLTKEGYRASAQQVQPSSLSRQHILACTVNLLVPFSNLVLGELRFRNGWSS